jgi:hypothetical protein
MLTLLLLALFALNGLVLALALLLMLAAGRD